MHTLHGQLHLPEINLKIKTALGTWNSTDSNYLKYIDNNNLVGAVFLVLKHYKLLQI